MSHPCLSRFACWLAAFLAFVSVPPAFAADNPANTSLVVSIDNSPVNGKDFRYSYTASSGKYSASALNETVEVSLYAGAVTWTLRFASPQYTVLEPGTYSGALTRLEADPALPGLSVDGLNWVNGGVIGEFEIKKLVRNVTGEVNSFEAKFSQKYKGGPGVLHGTIRLHALSNEPPGNFSPIAFAGKDTRLPFGTPVNLQGRIDDDGLPLPSSLSCQWTKISGPGTVHFDNASSPATAVTLSEKGSYVLRLTASDGQNTERDDVTVETYDPNERTSFSFVSDPGDPAGVGETQFYTLADGDFIAGRTGTNGVYVGFSNPAQYLTWTLNFAAPSNLPLSVGRYTGAVRTSEIVKDAPSLSVYRSPESVFEVQGSFDVREIEYGEGNTLRALRVVFEQHANFGGPALRGEIRYNASASNDPPNLPPTVRASGKSKSVVLGRSLKLTGSAQDDGFPDGSVLSTRWSTATGPGEVTFSNPTGRATTATFPAPGRYVLLFTGSDGFFNSSAEVAVRVVDPAIDTSLTIRSAPGDPAGRGENGFYTTANGTFKARSSEGLVKIDFLTFTGSVAWSLIFDGPAGASMHPGKYSGAVGNAGGVRVPLMEIQRPFKYVLSTGSFEIKKIVYGPHGTLFSFWATFEQYTQGSRSPLRGEIRYKADSIAAGVNRPMGVHVERYIRASSLTMVPLDGFADDDRITTSPLQVTWEKTEGPGEVTFDNAHAIDAKATFSEYGQYNLHLTVSDGEFTRSFDNILVSIFDTGTRSSLTMVSEPGDYIGEGLTYFFDGAEGRFTVESSDARNVTVRYREEGGFLQSDNWSLSFGSAGAEPLAIGTYTDAQRFGFQETGHPGLSVSGNGRGGGSIAGTFTIKELERSPAGVILRFRATFEQRIEGTTPALRGEICIDSTGTTPTRSLVVDAGQDFTTVVRQPVLLAASASYAGDGAPESYIGFFWEQVSGPLDALLNETSYATTQATFFVPGQYVFRCMVSDGEVVGSDEVTVTVKPRNLAQTGTFAGITLNGPAMQISIRVAAGRAFTGTLRFEDGRVLRFRGKIGSYGEWTGSLGPSGADGFLAIDGYSANPIHARLSQDGIVQDIQLGSVETRVGARARSGIFLDADGAGGFEGRSWSILDAGPSASAQLSGELPDGTAFTTRPLVYSDGSLLVFSPFSNGEFLRGVIRGSGAGFDGSLAWSRSSLGSLPLKTNGFALPLVSKSLNPLTGTTDSVAATVTISHASLASPVVEQVSVHADGSITPLSSESSLAFETTRKGVFSGTFTLPAGGEPCPLSGLFVTAERAGIGFTSGALSAGVTIAPAAVP